MNIKIALMAATLLATPATAHDFWVQPERYQVAVGQPLSATFQVGHGQFRQRWGNDISRIPLIVDFSASGRVDQRAAVRAGGDEDFVTTLTGPGIHVIAMQTTSALSNLPALRFNDYAKAEGLAAVIATRNQLGQNSLPGRERYSRRAKALVQVGAQTKSNSAFATRPLGMKLEIVPLLNPYILGASRRLPVAVLYKNRPLANATVMLTNLAFDARPLQTVVTDARGRGTFTVPPVGDWLLNVLWSEPINGDSQADFDTTFSSLTFGYNPANRAH
ncbi:MAG: DUF4198 domain-containing protein [Sphingomicrobium sp.]